MIVVSAPVMAADQLAGDDFQYALFGFAGVMTDADMAKTATIVGADYEDNVVLGGGGQYFPYQLGSVKFGIEGGLAARMGDDVTGEIWAGVVARYDSIHVTDHFFISPAFTFGISHVTGTQPGRETRQEEEDNGDASTLFYLGPEINVSFSENARTEVFWRLQHRSGAWGTLGDMHGGSNANVLGVRYKF